MAFTLTTIRERLERRTKDLNDIGAELLYDMATDLNQQLYDVMLEEDPARFIITQNYTVSTSPSTQALPAGFRDIKEWGCGFYVQSSSGVNTSVELPITGFGSIDWGYYIDGTNVVFTGINASTTIVLRYIPVLADITSMAGTFCVPDEFKALVLEGMMLAYYKNEEDPREGISDQRFARLLAKFKDSLPKGPRVITLPSPFESSISPDSYYPWITPQ